MHSKESAVVVWASSQATVGSCPKDAIWVYEAGGPGHAGGVMRLLQIDINP